MSTREFFSWVAIVWLFLAALGANFLFVEHGKRLDEIEQKLKDMTAK